MPPLSVEVPGRDAYPRSRFLLHHHIKSEVPICQRCRVDVPPLLVVVLGRDACLGSRYVPTTSLVPGRVACPGSRWTTVDYHEVLWTTIDYRRLS